MKKRLILMTLVASAIAHANPSELSTDEIAFIAKLEDKNRKVFADKLSQEQRMAVLVAFKNGANPDEAVHLMIAAQEVKERKSVAQAE